MNNEAAPKTFYQQVEDTEKRVVAYAMDARQDPEEFKQHWAEYLKYKGENNKETRRKMFEFLQTSTEGKRAVFSCMPFFETTWLLMALNENHPAYSGVAASKILQKVNEAMQGELLTDFHKVYAPLLQRNAAIPRPDFNELLELAKKGQPFPEIRSVRYRKLIGMLALRARVLRKTCPVYWSDIAQEVFPELGLLWAAEEPTKKDNRPKHSIIGDIGALDAPIYMPFISTNYTAVLKIFRDAILAQGGQSVALRKVWLSFPYTQALLFTTAKLSKAMPFDVSDTNSPIEKLGQHIYLAEHIRHRRGVVIE